MTLLNEQSCKKTRTKVLLVGPLPPTVGGITSFLAGLLKSSLAEQYDLCEFGTERPTSKLFKRISGYGMIWCTGLTNSLKSVVCTISHLLTFPFSLIRKRPNIVHIHTASYWSFWENAFYVVIARAFCRKTILHIHGGTFDKFYLKSNNLSKFVMRWIMNLSNVVIVLSPTWENFFGALLPSKKLAIVGNYVDTLLYDNDAKSTFGSKEINVMFIGGSEAKRKGVYDLIAAASIIAKQKADINFTFVSCSSVEGIENICKQESISNCTQILGFVSENEKIKILQSSDIFVLPSYGENFPVTVIEAMAAGLPVIATRVGAIPDVIDEGTNGFLIEAGDYQELAEKILLLSRDTELRQKMSKNNVEAVRENYTKTAILERISNQYNKLVRN